MKNLEIINLLEDDYQLFEYCKKNGLFKGTYDDFFENGESLAFFEGDPDMLKWNNQIIYFALVEDKVFYYSDTFGTEKAQIEGILRDFFTTGCISHTGYYTKYLHTKKVPANCQNWDAWESMKAGIAYRGGCGYIYDIIPLRAAA